MGFAETIAYVNARVRARKSRLLGIGRLSELARAPGVEDVVKGLRDTPYAVPLAQAAATEAEPAQAAEDAFSRNLTEDISQIRGFVPGLAEPPGRYLFSSWDVRNLKTVLRGVHARAELARSLAACFPAGWIHEAVWAELGRSGAVEEAIEKAVTMDLGFRQALRDGLRAYRKTRQLTSLEEALDRHFFADAFRDLEGAEPLWQPLGDLVRFDVDARNAAAALEWLGRLERPPEDLLIPGGHRTGHPFGRELASQEEPVAFLAGWVPRWLGPSGTEVSTHLQAGRVGEAQETLERAAWRVRSRRLKGDPLSLNILIGYLWAKAAEVADLRRIVWGLQLGTPPGWIEAGFLSE